MKHASYSCSRLATGGAVWGPMEQSQSHCEPQCRWAGAGSGGGQTRQCRRWRPVYLHKHEIIVCLGLLCTRTMPSVPAFSWIDRNDHPKRHLNLNSQRPVVLVGLYVVPAPMRCTVLR